MMKIAVAFDRYGPYHIARLGAAAKQCDLVGLELSEHSTEYKWSKEQSAGQFQRVTLAVNAEFDELPWLMRMRRIREVLLQLKPDVVAVPGWSSSGSLMLLGWCSLLGYPIVMMSESNQYDFERDKWLERLKSYIFRAADAALVGGNDHIEYLDTLGFSVDRVFKGYNVVDNDYFSEGVKRIQQQKVELGIKHDLPRPYFLTSARFIEKKNLARLISAYKTYRSQTAAEDCWDLVVLGDGDMADRLQLYVNENGLREFVKFKGFVQYDQLPVFYALAEVFVLVSTTEQWGLVVNEAMSSGLPVVVSNRCGCACELVVEGVTGFQVDPHSETAIAAALKKISSPELDIGKMATEARAKIALWQPRRFAEGLINAGSSAISTRFGRRKNFTGLSLLLLSFLR
jgi:1,2-diacylglycerol 3-alpha-glucosyltransferase